MRHFFVLILIALTLGGCSKGDEGGGGGGGNTPTVNNCTDPDASNFNFPLPCICPGGYIINGSGTACDPTGGSGSGSGGPLAPSALFYSQNPYSILVNNSITFPLAPSVNNCSGGCNFTTNFGSDANGHGLTGISGITINKNSGAIQGVAPGVPINRTITVTATNGVGSTNTSLVLRVLQRPPGGLTISSNNVTYRVGQSITPNQVNYTSGVGSITSMTIDPALPTGLVFSETDTLNKIWSITGTPTVSSTAATYTITACGPTDPCSTVQVSLATLTPPTTYSYDISSTSQCVSGSGGIPECTFSMLQSFNDINSVHNGDNVQFEVLSGPTGNALPLGIALASTGKIYTTSYGAFEDTTSYCGSGFCTYVLRVFNGVGSVQTTFKIKILPPAAATGFSYSPNSYTGANSFRVLTPITEIVPTFDNGRAPSCTNQAGCFTINPALPSGFSISALTGKINGSASVANIQSPVTYTITANQAGSPLTTTLTIEIKERLPIFSYVQGGSFVFPKGQDITTIGAPSVIQSGSSSSNIVCNDNLNSRIPITSFSISPALPAGLSLNTSALICGSAPLSNGGAITGTPSALSALKEYTVTGCNSGGCSTSKVYLEIRPDILKIVAGERHACAIIKADAASNTKVMCWGDNSKGQLGFTSTDSCSVPVEGAINCSKTGKYVKTLAGTDLQQVTTIAAGKNHTCAIVDTNPSDDEQETGYVGGQLYCWGDNTSGQLGIGSTVGQNRPTQVTRTDSSTIEKATNVSAGGNDTCFAAESIVPDGLGGQQELLRTVYCTGANYGNRGTRVGSGSNPLNSLFALEIGTGHDFACAVVSEVILDENSDPVSSNLGKVKCWGKNDRGQLGNGSTSSSFSSTPNLVSKIDTSTLLDAGEVVLGASHACIKDASSRPFCWGDNTYGQLGQGSIGGMGTRAAQVKGINNIGLFTALSIGSGSYTTFLTSNLTASGQESSFGIYNLGNFVYPGIPYSGTQTSTPTLLKREVGGTIMDFLSHGSPTSIGPSASTFACAKDFAGGLVCFGSNVAGQLGNTTTSDAVLPVRVNLSY